jgi:hypothetical protein
MDQSEALTALAAKRQAEAQIARAATCPPWRHAVFGLLMGGLVAAPAVELPARFALLAALLLAVPVIIHSDRKRMGMFINGYRRGKTRIVALVILAVELSLYGVSLYFGDDLHDRITPLLLGAVGFAIAIVGSLIWQRVFVSEMGV